MTRSIFFDLQRRPFVFLIFVASILFATGGLALAVDFSTTPDASWPSVNSGVNAITQDAAGNTYIGGSFTAVGAAAPRVLIVNASGTNQMPSLAVNSGINAAISDGSGGFYIGGDFTVVNGTSKKYLAHIGSDYSLDTNFDAGLDSTVSTIVASGTTLFIGGSFASVGGKPRGRFAAVNATTGAVVSVTGPIGFNGTVSTLVASSSGTIYAGGSFTAVGISSPRLAAFDTTTGVASSSFSFAGNSDIYVIIPDGSGGFYIGGAFTLINGVTRNRIAHISGTGTVDSFDPNVNSNVNYLALSGTTLYAGGDFTTVNNGVTARNRIAAFDTTTGTATSFDPNVSGSVSSLILSGTTLYAGGSFTTVNNGGSTRNRIAAFDTTLATGNVTTFDPNLGGYVRMMALSGTTLYAGGDFTTVNGGAATRNRVASFDTTTATNNRTTFDPNISSSVYGMVLSGTTLYVGGLFGGTNSVNGNTTRNYLAAFDTTQATANVTAFDPNPNSYAIALGISGTTLYASGYFTTVNGGAANRSYFASFDTTQNTSNVNAFNPIMDTMSGPYSGGISIVVSGSTVYMGGSFSIVNAATTRNRIVAIDVGMATTTAFNANVNNSVSAFVLSGNTLYAGGSFTTVNGGDATRNRLAAFDITQNASSVTSFDPNVNSNVSALVLSGTTLYAGGAFTTVNNGAATRSRLAAFDTTLATGNVTTFDPNVSSNVNALALSGTTLYAGGGFNGSNSVNGNTTRNYIAAFDTTVATGNVITSFDPNLDSSANAVAVSSGKIVLGGSFVLMNKVTRNRIAAFDSRGVLTSFDPNVNSTVNALVASGTTLYAGGSFTSVNNGATGRNRGAAFDTTLATSNVTSFNPDMNGTVTKLALTGNTLFLGGGFVLAHTDQTRRGTAAFNTDDGSLLSFNIGQPGSSITSLLFTSTSTLYEGGSIANQGRNGLGAWNTSDSSILSFDPNLNSSVTALALSGTTLYAGGNFTTVNNAAATRNYLAAFDTTTATNNRTTFDPNMNSTVSALVLSGTTLYAGGSFSTVNNGTVTRSGLVALNTTTGSSTSWNPGIFTNSSISALLLASKALFVGGTLTGSGAVNFARFAALTTAPTASIHTISNHLGLAAYWSLNDATGTKATDFSGNGKTGTLTNMSATPSVNWVSGKKSTALNFDGSDDYVVTAAPASTAVTDWTIALWVKRTGSGTGNAILVSNGTMGTDGYTLYLDSTDSFQLHVQHGVTANDQDTGIDVPINTWTHIACTMGSPTGGTTTQCYKDGVASGTTSALGYTTPTTSTKIGGGAGSNYLLGFLDEVRMYSRALSAAEIYNLYGEGLGRLLAPSRTGMIGEWSFDDATGTKATDFSGQGNTGTLTNFASPPTATSGWVKSGRRAGALAFDGSNDYVSVSGALSSTNITFSAWLYPTDTSGIRAIFRDSNTAHSLYIYNGNLRDYSGDSYHLSYALTANTWTHVVYTKVGAAVTLYFNGVSVATDSWGSGMTLTAITIGGDAYSQFFVGKMDDLRFYNRALTAAEVAGLYTATSQGSTRITTVSRNGLVGYWTMEDGIASTTTDFSGNGNAGTLTNGPTWTGGRRGSAVSFDGTDDYINVADANSLDIASTGSVSYWFKRNASGTGANVGKWTASGNQRSYNLEVYTDDKIYWTITSDGTGGSGSTKTQFISTSTYTDTNWHHLVGTFSSGTMTVYLDGASIAGSTTGTASSVYNSTSVLQIGAYGGGTYTNGLIDEVRVYNRALSADEIQTLYNTSR